MAKNILKEAIADAKAVREVALANAKAALEEAFTPKLQNMLSAKLSEDLDEDYYDEDEKEIELGEMGNMYDEDMDEDMYEEEKEDSMDDEIDLEEILNELESEEGDDANDDEEDLEEVHRVGQPNYKADGVSDVLNRASDINDNLAESNNFDLDSLLKEINDLEDEEILEIENDEGEEIDEIENKAMKKIRKKLGKVFGTNERTSRSRGCVAENRKIKSLQSQLRESISSSQKIRQELNEVNLLNSKLLYVNRIFKANNLDDAQKLRVVETLDKAGSVKEAKLIYETVKNTFTLSSNKKKKTISKKPIRENFGMASKATRTSAPRKPILKESNNMVARMQKLANISKIK